LVIDIKSSGRSIIFSDDCATKEFLSRLHKKNLYLIARIVVFKGGPRRWYEPSSQKRWQQVAEISRKAIDLGFDEINYDYIRYGAVNEPKSNTPISKRRAIINAFFKFLKKEVRDKTGRPISADIFGITFIYPQAVIGQSLEDVIQSFDYIMPMPYPSHWYTGSFGFKNPAHHPYKVVFKSLTMGWDKVKDHPKRIAKLRTWIQAFSLDSKMRYYPYTPWHIREQIRACYHTDCTGWALWNPYNRYNITALLPLKDFSEN